MSDEYSEGFPLPIDDEFREAALASADGLVGAEAFRSRRLNVLLEEYEESRESEDPRERFVAAMDFLSAVAHLDQTYETKAHRAVGPLVARIVSALGDAGTPLPDEVVEAVFRSAGLTPPADQPDEEVDGEVVPGDSTIEGIDPDFVAEPDRKLDFDGKYGDEDGEASG